jgi:hypothetical protein
MLAVVGSDGYKTVFMLHILAVIVGFGTVFLNGVYGKAAGDKKGPEALFLSETMEKVGQIAEYVIYTVPLFGLGLVFMSKSGGEYVWKFSQTWVWLALVLYVIALGIATGMHLPNIRRMNALQRELVAMGPPPGAGPGAAMQPPPQVAELEARGKRAAILGTLLNVFVVVLVYLMVFKPGV